VAAAPTLTLVPIGSDYQPDTLQLFANEASERSTDNQVHILVLPITYSLSADGTTKSERKKNLTLADHRRSQVEAACNVVRTPSQTCFVQLVPVLVRSDAVAFDPAPYFTADLDGMFVLGGDQTVAMNTVHDPRGGDDRGVPVGRSRRRQQRRRRRPVEGHDQLLRRRGPAESMRKGAVKVCFDADRPTVRAACLSASNVITDQHVFECGRTGRSLNVALDGQAGARHGRRNRRRGRRLRAPARRDQRHARLRHRSRAYGATTSGGPNQRCGPAVDHLLPLTRASRSTR
jgi:hypothetical protein